MLATHLQQQAKMDVHGKVKRVDDLQEREKKDHRFVKET